MDIILIKTGKNKVEVFNETTHGVLPEQHITVKGFTTEPTITPAVKQLLNIVKKQTGNKFHIPSEEAFLSDSRLISQFFPEKQNLHNSEEELTLSETLDNLIPDPKHGALSLLEVAAEKLQRGFNNLKTVREHYDHLTNSTPEGLTGEQKQSMAEDFQKVFKQVEEAIIFTENAQTQTDTATKMVDGWFHHTVNVGETVEKFRRNNTTVQAYVKLLNPVKLSGTLAGMFDIFDNINIEEAENIKVEAIIFTTGGFVKPEYVVKLSVEGWVTMPEKYVATMNQLMDREAELIEERAKLVADRMFKLSTEISRWNENNNYNAE